jgi:aryl-alcohol dehydrogenase-like predicted oxidoreductase
MLDVIEKTQYSAIGGDAFHQQNLTDFSGANSGVSHRTWKAGEKSVSLLGIGCARAGSIRNFTPVSEIRNMLSMALDHGVNVIDTANIYGQGDSERIVGRAIKGRRNDAFLVTKIGFTFGGSSRLVTGLKPLLRVAAKYSNLFDKKLTQTRDNVISQDFSPHQLSLDLEGSLKRLDVEVIDCLMLHSPPKSVLEDGAVAECLRRFKSDGKIKHFGASVETLGEARSALNIEGLELLQIDVDTARKLATGQDSKTIARKNIALHVREVLKPHGAGSAKPVLNVVEALPNALAISNVTSAIVGLSSRKHLQSAIDAIR